MSKSSNSVLVLDGETVKLRILAERQFSGNTVHVDWVRFTTLLRNAPIPHADVLFPCELDPNIYYLDEQDERNARLIKALRDIPDYDFSASAQAYELASKVAQCLGSSFTVDVAHRKGMDFYRFRWSILLNDTEVAWVGFLAATESPSRSRQNSTIHVNVMGTACTFAEPGWNDRMADLVDECEAVLTRADLAVDFFDGYDGGIDSVREDYRNGLCNVGGRKLKFNLVGDWENGHDRSVYLGSRQTGKVTNIYEKGDQLYGEKFNSEWLRFELRYGNKVRVLDSDMLRRPDDFFAGASDWHQSVMLKAHAIFNAQKIPRIPRLPIESVKAECSRNVRWMYETAASTMAVAVQFLDSEKLWEMIGNAKLPGRLRKFSMSQIAECFGDAFNKLSTAGSSPNFATAF